jgi:hypothetical protein
MPDMDALYAWTEEGPEGKEGVIAAASGLLGPVVHLLQHRRREIAEQFRPIAEQHRQRTGHRVRLVRFARAEELEELR